MNRTKHCTVKTRLAWAGTGVLVLILAAGLVWYSWRAPAQPAESGLPVQTRGATSTFAVRTLEPVSTRQAVGTATPTVRPHELIASYSVPKGQFSFHDEYIASACRRLTGTVVGPGERFSFWDTLGDPAVDASFIGHLYSNYELSKLACALYNAFINAGLSPEQRHPYLYSGGFRVDPGREAVVRWPDMDLVLANPGNSEVTIILSTDEDGDQIVADVWGQPLPSGQTIVLEVVTIEVLAPGEPIHVADEAVIPGETEIRVGRAGYRCVSWAVRYDGAGHVLGRTRLYEDCYPPFAQEIHKNPVDLVGVETRPAQDQGFLVFPIV